MESSTTRVSIKTNYRSDTHKQRSYIVRCHKHRVLTTVTSTPGVVRRWIGKVINAYRHYLLRNRLIVGLGVLWAPQTPHTPAVLTLCVGRHCLVFQLGLADRVPMALRRFLAHPSNRFLGVWNHRDGPMLEECVHNLEVSSLVELRNVAAERRGTPLQITMEKMAEEILGFKGVKKDVETGRSDWNAYWLTPDQVLYASLDAFLSFLLGYHLKPWTSNFHISTRKPSPENRVYSMDNGDDVGFESRNNGGLALVVEQSSGGEPTFEEEYEFVDKDDGYEASPRPRLAVSDDDEDDEHKYDYEICFGSFCNHNHGGNHTMRHRDEDQEWDDDYVWS